MYHGTILFVESPMLDDQTYSLEDRCSCCISQDNCPFILQLLHVAGQFIFYLRLPYVVGQFVFYLRLLHVVGQFVFCRMIVVCIRTINALSGLIINSFGREISGSFYSRPFVWKRPLFLNEIQKREIKLKGRKKQGNAYW